MGERAACQVTGLISFWPNALPRLGAQARPHCFKFPRPSRFGAATVRLCIRDVCRNPPTGAESAPCSSVSIR